MDVSCQSSGVAGPDRSRILQGKIYNLTPDSNGYVWLQQMSLLAGRHERLFAAQTEVAVVAAGMKVDHAIFQEQYPGYQRTEKMAVMADHQNGSGKFL
jgi:hypothetical protein